MISFKEYFLLEVKASKNNIALFKKRYSDHHMYKAQMYQAEGEAGSDEDEFIEMMIDRFNELVKRGTMKQKDIFGFKDFGSFMDELDKAERMKSGSELKRIEKEGAIRVFENDKAIVVHPKTHEASCHYGAGAKWCTAAKDPDQFKSYTNDQGVVLLYLLPKSGKFERVEGTAMDKVRPVTIDSNTIDDLLLLHPQVFGWTDQAGRAIDKYIRAAYMNERESESVDTIASWSPDNAESVRRARVTMLAMMEFWNKHGGKVTHDILGPYNQNAAENGEENEMVRFGAIDGGLRGMLYASWQDIEPHSPGASFDSTEMRSTEKVMAALRDNRSLSDYGGGEGTARGERAYDKLAIAVYAMKQGDGGWLDAGEQADEMEATTGLDHAFGDFAAEGFDAEDTPMSVSDIVNATGLTNQDIKKINEYIKMYAEDKVWEDKDPKHIFKFMEIKANQTPENIAKADAFFLNEPNVAFSSYAWDYARQIRARAHRTKQDDYLEILGDEREQKRKPWLVLEKLFIDQIDEAQKEGKQAKDFMLRKLEWSEVQKMEKEFGMDAGAVTDHINQMWSEWQVSRQPVANFLSLGSGLLGYLFHVKKYNWPDLEKRILDPKYSNIYLHKLGPDWIQHGRNGERWEEYEETLYKIWMDTTSQPFRNEKTIEKASMLKNQANAEGVPHWEVEQAKENVRHHFHLYGNPESVIDVVKATKRSYGGGTGGSEEAAWHEAEDAWWNNPEIVALYWGHGTISKKQKPSEKRLEKEATKYFVNGDRYVKRPFYHEVKPGAWLPGIPNIFTLSTSHIDAQYVGQYNPGEPPQMSVGNLIDRHEGRRRG